MDTDYMSRLFWNENFWLPVGTSWEDLEAPSSKDVYYPRAVDMCWSLLAGVFLLGFRYFYERFLDGFTLQRAGIIPSDIHHNLNLPIDMQYAQSPN